MGCGEWEEEDGLYQLGKNDATQACGRHGVQSYENVEHVLSKVPVKVADQMNALLGKNYTLPDVPYKGPSTERVPSSLLSKALGHMWK